MPYPKIQDFKSGHGNLINCMTRGVATRSAKHTKDGVNFIVFQVVEGLFVSKELLFIQGSGSFIWDAQQHVEPCDNGCAVLCCSHGSYHRVRVRVRDLWVGVRVRRFQFR